MRRGLGVAVATVAAAGTAVAQPGQVVSGVYWADAPAAKLGGQTGGGEAPTGHYYLTFFADGRVKRGRPDQGLSGFDDAFWMKTDVRSGDPKLVRRWGGYQLAGPQGHIMFMTRETWDLDISGYPESLKANGRVYRRLGSGDGLAISGLYKAVSGDSSIRFLPGGRMTEEGVFNNCVSSGPHFSYGGSIPSMSSGTQLCIPKPTSGAYLVGHYTLALKLADGTSPSFAFWVEPGGEAIWINDVRYEPAR